MISEKEKEICAKKIRYSDELTARAAASYWCVQKDRKKSYIYECPVCKGYHVTTKRRKSRKYTVTQETTYIKGRGVVYEGG